MILGDEDLVRAARFLQEQGVRIVVQKRGFLGCIICQEKEEIRCAPYAVNVVDSTGAGDRFAAGFLLVWLRGKSLSIAGEHGNAAGALSVSSAVSVTGLLPEPEFTVWRSNAERPPAQERDFRVQLWISRRE